MIEAARALPQRQAGDKTHGCVLGPTGVAVNVASGRQASKVAGLHRRFRPVTVDHAEGHAAALLRQSAARQASLVLNNTPCTTCDDELPKMLPAGKTLHVYVRNADGVVEPYRTYDGTGEAISS